MSSLRGDKHSLNISIKSKDELNYNPATRSITTHQMESIKRMTKTMSIHRQKKLERRPERQRTNTELSLNSPSENQFCARHNLNTSEENIKSKIPPLCHINIDQKKSTRNDPPHSDIVPSRVNHDALSFCEYVDCRNVVIRQIFVTDNLSCRPSSSSLRHTSSLVDNISVTSYAASTTTSWKEQNKICPLKTDIADKNLLNEQTIKSEHCSYMPQMQQPRNNTSMIQNLPKTTKLNMLPSSTRIELDNYNSDNDVLTNNITDNNMNNTKQENTNNSKDRWISDIFERLCPPTKSWMPFRNNESYDELIDSSNKSSHSDHLSIFRMWPSMMNMASMKMSATTKSYLMLLVLLFITNMAGACSSRSTPKPRPPTHSAMRPNITFQTYACPKAYAEWYCLNGATCFTVKIADSILYNCECADGYMGQRCEFKDLEGSYLPARERLLMGSGRLSGTGLLGQLGSSIGINSSNIGNAFICVLIVIVLAIIVSAVYTHNRTKSKLARAKLTSAQKLSSLSSLPTQSISALADGLEMQNSSWSGSILTMDHRNESAHHQRSYSLSPSDMNRSASSRGLWIRGSGNKDKKGRSKSSFFWRSTSESSGRSSKSFSSENPGDISSEVSSQKTRHLSTISYSLSQSDSAPSTPSPPMEYCPTSTIEIQSSCYPSIEEQYYTNGGLSRHVPYSQRGGRCGGHSPSPENIEMKTSSRILRESPIAQNSGYYPYPSSIKSAPAQTSNFNESTYLQQGRREETLNNQMSNVRTTLQGHDGYRNGHFSI